MISVDECILLMNGYVSELYVPEFYVLPLDHVIREGNWMVIPSEVPGWMILRRRMVLQD